MHILVAPRMLAEQLPSRPDGAVISITNPQQAPAFLEGWPRLLRLGFYDVEEPAGSFMPMSLADALAILRFVARCKPAFLLVHCEFGASRSAAVGVFLAQWLNCEVHRTAPGIPNSWVTRQLRRAATQYGSIRPWCWPALHRIFCNP